MELIDFNAELHFRNRGKLKRVLRNMDRSPVVSDAFSLTPFYKELETCIDGEYETVRWEKYPLVYVTSPSWFPTVPTEAVLRLSRAIRRVSPGTRLFFFGNSLGTWTNESELKENGVHTVHLNALFCTDARPRAVRYDLLPPPLFGNRGKYIFDILPFMLKHGCSWGQCRFCSLSKGWNGGNLERSAKCAMQELEVLIDRYDPSAFVCRDNSLNGLNLIEFCGYLERLHKPWGGMSRADLSERKIEALRRAGCRVIFFGLESGSDTALQAINKGITAKQMSDFIKRLHANGIMPAPSIVTGMPGERKADSDQTIRFLADHRSYFDVVNVYPFMATPSSHFSFQGRRPARSAPVKLFQCIEKCRDLGLKVCVGEQCAEYVLFKRFYSGHLAIS